MKNQSGTKLGKLYHKVNVIKVDETKYSKQKKNAVNKKEK